MDDHKYLAALDAAFAIARMFGRLDPVTLGRITYAVLEAIDRAEAAPCPLSGDPS